MPVGLRGRMIGNAAPVRPVLPTHQQLSTNTQYDTCVDIQFPADILCHFVRWLRFPRHNSADTRRTNIKHCRKRSLGQVHFIHSQFHHIGERWSTNSKMFLGVVSHEVRQQLKLDETCVIFRRIVVYQESNSSTRLTAQSYWALFSIFVILALLFYMFRQSILSYSLCVPMNRIYTNRIVNLITATRRKSSPLILNT